MRKLISILLLTMILGTAFHAYAQSSVYDIEELACEFALPDTLTVLTRELIQAHPLPASLQLGSDALMEYVLKKDIYIFAQDEANEAYIEIAANENAFAEDIGSLKSLKKYEIEALAEQLVQYSEPAYAEDSGMPGDAGKGYAFASYFIYETKHAKYIALELLGNLEEGQWAGHEFLTISDGKYISFSIKTSKENFSARHTRVLLDILETCTFDANRRDKLPTSYAVMGGIALLAGGMTMLSAQKRKRELDKNRRKRRTLNERKTQAYCPHCNARMPYASEYCYSCGEWAGNAKREE